VGATAAWAERRLTAHNMGSTLTVFDSCAKGVKSLEASGYRPVDTMTVLVSNDSTTASLAHVAIKQRPAPDSWTKAYLQAFYGDQELAPHITPIVARLLKLKAVTLLEGEVEGVTAGVLAIFRTAGLAGIYCVGTVPEHRRKGVANILLSKAKAIAGAEGKRLFLQSLSSDGSLHYYLERGFSASYSKKLLSRESSNANKKEHV
jgi:GNAT superfamily N-acetyltransferase